MSVSQTPTHRRAARADLSMGIGRACVTRRNHDALHISLVKPLPQLNVRAKSFPVPNGATATMNWPV